MNRSASSCFASLALCFSSLAYADVCTAPGETVLEDPSGDTAFQGVIPVPSPAGDMYDLLSLNVAAPPAATGEDRKIIFTIKLKTQQPTPGMIPGTAIFSSFVDSKQTVRGVRVQSDNSGGMTFFSYVAGPSSSTGGNAVTDGRFVAAGSEKPAEPESSYTGGVATLVVKFKDLKLKPEGDSIRGFNAATTQALSVSGVGGVAGTIDTMPDDLVHATALDIPKCTGKSADGKAASEGSDKSGTSFGGAFGLWNLLMLPLALRRRRAHR